MKTCSKCNKIKPLSDFTIRSDNGSLRSECRSCMSLFKRAFKEKHKEKYSFFAKRWYSENRDHVIKKSRKWSLDNKDRVSENKRNYYISNAGRIKFYLHKNKEKTSSYRREYMRSYASLKSKTDIKFKLSLILRRRLREAIKNDQKSGSAVADLGCSIAKLKIHLQLKFHRNPRNKHEYMTWDNYGRFGWHIDHIRPLSTFNLSDPEQLKIACHYTNLQPLWWSDNLSKGSK